MARQKDTYVSRFSEIEDEIQSRDHVTQQTFFSRKKINKAKFKKIETQIGRKIPESMGRFYSEMNGLYMQWRYTDPDDRFHTITGKSEIRPIEKVFSHLVSVWGEGGWHDEVFWSADATEDQIRAFHSLMVLDELEYGNYVVFRLPDDQDEPELFLFCYHNHLYPLDLSLDEYLDLLFQTRGMYFWQEYATLPGSVELDTGIPDRFHENMSRLFPDVDLSKLRKIELPLARSIYNVFMAKKKKVDYRGLFAERVEELKKNKNIVKIEFTPNEGVSLGAVRKAKESLGRELPESLLCFYLNMNGFRLEWTCEEAGADVIKGFIDMLPLEHVLGGFNGLYRKDWNDEVFRNVLWMEDDDEEDIEFMKPFKMFDGYEGLNINIVLRFVEGQEEPELFLNDRWNYYPLTITFAEYLERQLDTLGLEFWQYYVTDPKSFTDFSALPPFHDRMARVFPGVNLSRFRRIKR
jgi:hypothetical protein